MGKTKYIFFDIDGTLSFDKQNIGEKNAEYIKKVQSLGHKVFINTGRSFAYLPENIKNALCWNGIVAGSGYIIYEGQVIYNKTLSVPSLEAIYNYCKKRNIMCLFEGVERLYSNMPNPNTSYNIDDFLPMREELHITKVTVDAEIPPEDIPVLKGVNVISMPGYFEGVPEGHDKDTGLKIIQSYCGISREDLIAFGDSLNDKAMLKYAGTSVIMRHAPQELDKYAAIRTNLDHEGVAEGLSLIFGI